MYQQSEIEQSYYELTGNELREPHLNHNYRSKELEQFWGRALATIEAMDVMEVEQ